MTAADGAPSASTARLGALLAAPAPARGRLWLTNARLFDGTGAAAATAPACSSRTA